MIRDPGQILLPRAPNFPGRREVAAFDARAAAAAALGAYLRSAEFRAWGGEGPDKRFNLTSVHEEWPEGTQQLEYPSAALSEIQDPEQQAHNFVPTALEETIDVFGAGTVLWKLAEASIVFQVDFFCQSKPDREAIAAALPGLFSPGDEKGGVILTGHPVYYCVPVRCTLESGPRRIDTSDAVFESERRLTARVRCDVDQVELRCATVLVPSAQILAGETQDTEIPAPEPELLEPGCCNDTE